MAIIRNERRIELIGEGYREDDWRRWRAHGLFNGKRKKGLKIDTAEYSASQPVDDNGLLDPQQNTLPNGYQFDPDKQYLYPIPLGDLELNPNLTQNPGWDTP